MAVEGIPAVPKEKFQTPEQELAHLRERLSHIEQQLGAQEGAIESAATQVVREYAAQKPEDVLHKDAVLPEKQAEAIVLDLAPEEHDTKMAELLALMHEKGVQNTLSIIQKMNNPHLEDDFHRFLVEYLKEGHSVKGLKEEGPIWKDLTKTLFEVTVPSIDKESGQKELEELLSSMEQLYAGMMTITDNHLTLELSTAINSEHAVFYIAVPNRYIHVFEKQLLSIFPQARVYAQRNDYNVFNTNGASVGSYAVLKRQTALPLKVYEAFDYDPLNVLLSTFSKLSREGEGAAIQLVFKPTKHDYGSRFKRALDKLRKGEKVSTALDVPETVGEELIKGVKDLFFTKTKSKEAKEEERLNGKTTDDIVIEQVTKKISSPIVAANIRLIASGETAERAEHILSELEAAFHQYEEAQGNKLVFKRVSGVSARRFFYRFSFRKYGDDERILLNLKELTTLYHLPNTNVDSSRELKRNKAGTAPAPIGVSEEGVLLGNNIYRGTETPVYFSSEDRLRHFYVIGQTGTGKTSILKNMIVQDIQNGEGVCMIDPHGSDIQDVLGQIPPERHKDVVYFDPSYIDRPMGLNMLEYDTRFPEQKTFVVNELFSIFQKLYGAVPESMGPMFEQYFRNATMLVIEDPSTGNTLLDVSRVLADSTYRALKLSRCSNPVVKQFWEEVASKAGGEAALANIVPYITSKFDVFLANDIMRPIVAQPVSAFNFRKIMDERKILLVNLSKGRLGEINANLLGLIVVGKILMAALSRVDSSMNTVPSFYLYIDEFQNVTTDSIATILSEARKYKLGLNIAHQFIAQLEDNIKDAVFGNVGSLCVFRVGADDAEYLEQQFDPPFTKSDLMNVDNFNAYVKMLVNGEPVKPFNITTLKPKDGDTATVEMLKQQSYETYGRARDDIEREIMDKYR